MQDTFERLVGVLDQVAGIDPGSVRPDHSFVDDLDVDSLTMVEVLVDLEDRFGVKIEEDDARSLRTVGDMVAYLDKAGLSA
ncbi:acyl carrier protein [Pseudonocardia sp. CNS-139]|nr:acyl carrier protein [Pseudonocardia sp. CNS-139]